MRPTQAQPRNERPLALFRIDLDSDRVIFPSRQDEAEERNEHRPNCTETTMTNHPPVLISSKASRARCSSSASTTPPITSATWAGAYEAEQSPAAKDAIAQILTNSRMRRGP
jgi:hypothetical protein